MTYTDHEIIEECAKELNTPFFLSTNREQVFLGAPPPPDSQVPMYIYNPLVNGDQALDLVILLGLSLYKDDPESPWEVCSQEEVMGSRIESIFHENLLRAICLFTVKRRLMVKASEVK